MRGAKGAYMSCRYGLLIGAVLALSGCPSTRPTQVKEVKVTVTKYVAVPDKYLRKDAIPMPTNDTVKEATIVAKKRKASLEICYGQLDSIGKIQGASADGE